MGRRRRHFAHTAVRSVVYVRGWRPAESTSRYDDVLLGATIYEVAEQDPGPRLPTEAEWEYAARAGTKTAWSFGDDAGKLGDYAWTEDNGDGLTHSVGEKKPNPWGLCDIHGNVAEWTLDQYYPDAYSKLGAGVVDAAAAVQWPIKSYPRVIRGGSWYEPAAMSRSAARHKS